MIRFPFNNQYVTLGEEFFFYSQPDKVRKPWLIKFNEKLAGELGIVFDNPLDSEEAARVFSGNQVPDGAQPIAMAYAGHQFGQFVPQLGDGRAILLGEIVGVNDSRRYSVQLKGSGLTDFSRNGDGRSALGPVLREYLVSEAMHKLNIPTTRALAAVTTGEPVARERLLPGGVITRVAASFVRVGTFQYFSARQNEQAIRSLADHVIVTNYSASTYSKVNEESEPYLALLQAVVDRQARLIASWMGLGFIHGVMNTDNMSVAGETIDYGPCAFMDAFSHQKVFSSIDRIGRYAYRNQPAIALWNLSRFAETLLPLFSDDLDQAVKLAQEILETFIDGYEGHWLKVMRAKLGILERNELDGEDKSLIEDFLDMLEANEADFSLSFYYLSRLDSKVSAADDRCRELFKDVGQFEQWLERWRLRIAVDGRDDSQRQQAMCAVNPIYIPRNHQIEAAIRAAEDHGDFSVFHELHNVLQAPFTYQNGKDRYMLPPQPEEEVLQTFCGT